MPTPPPPVEYQFRPGESGNPGGRSKGSLTKRLREAMERENEAGRDAVDALIAKLQRQAIGRTREDDGDLKAKIYIFDRLDGKIPIVIQEEAAAIVNVTILRTEANPAPLALEGPTTPADASDEKRPD